MFKGGGLHVRKKCHSYDLSRADRSVTCYARSLKVCMIDEPLQIHYRIGIREYFVASVKIQEEV